jgi:uncharacterized protein (DUF488 family)
VIALCTIGFTKKSLPEFIGRLRGAGVTKLVDIRLRNTSQLAGYAKREDLEFVLGLCSIQYEHQPLLAPSEDLLRDYRKTKDWQQFEDRFRSLLHERSSLPLILASIDGHRSICLLCSEDQPEHCHRRLVAEYVQEREPEIEVRHL